MWCGPPPGKWYTGLSLTESHGGRCKLSELLDFWFRRHLPVASPCQKSAIRRPTVKAASCPKTVTILKESRGAGTRSCAGSRPAIRQRGQRNQRRQPAFACAEVSTATPPIALAGRSLEVPRRKMSDLGPSLKCMQKRTLPLVADVEIDGVLVA